MGAAELGDLVFARSGDEDRTAEVLKSADSDSGESVPQSVQFLVDVEDDGAGVASDEEVAEEGGGRGGSSLVLCWVESDGNLCHHYTYGGNVLDHLESTFIGDAFVVYRTLTSSAPQPQTASDLIDDGASYKILCSYRLREAVDRNVYTHKVEWSPKECRVTSVANDDEYRVVAEIPKGHSSRLPPPDESWELTYTYICPPVPNSSSWNKGNQTFYVWGDIDFDDYGASHLGDVVDEKIRNLHPCTMNQIVPQVMIGNCLCSNDDEYEPSWRSFGAWVIQAQYFWQDCDGKARAQCGPLVRAEPGDKIRTRIGYDHESGCINVLIAIMKKEDDGEKTEYPEKRSTIVIERPFPHDPSLFANWTDFFERCIDAERSINDANPPALRGSKEKKPVITGCLARPCLNVEYKGRVSVETLKCVCPFVVREVSFPGSEQGSNSNWRARMFSPRTGYGDTLDGLEEDVSLHVSDAISLCQSG